VPTDHHVGCLWSTPALVSWKVLVGVVSSLVAVVVYLELWKAAKIIETLVYRLPETIGETPCISRAVMRY
jgi:hypothetical protein